VEEIFDEFEHKWLVTCVNSTIEVPIEFEDYIITQTYLQNDDDLAERVRVERPCYSTKCVRTHTIKRPIEGGGNRETNRIITKEEAIELRTRAIGEQIRKIRIVFLYEGQKFELDWFIKPVTIPTAIMEAEVEDLKAPIKLPPFIRVIAEVTGDPRFSNGFIARNPRETEQAIDEQVRRWKQRRSGGSPV